MSQNVVMRVTLNERPLKELVIVSQRENRPPVIQIHKNDEITGQFDYEDIVSLLKKPESILKITTFFYGKKKTKKKLLHHYESIDNHDIHFSKLRGKPFLSIESVGPYREVNGVPLIDICHLGITAWTALLNNSTKILMTLARTFPYDNKEREMHSLLKKCRKVHKEFPSQ